MDVLCCRITIGDADPANPMKITDGVEITEVHTLEINESYKKLIGTAKVTFPKGTVCRSTIIGTVTLEGKDASRLTTEIMQDGVIIEKRTTQRLVDETTFKVGQRINIKLGYNGVMKNMFDGYITGYNSDSMLEIQCENMAYKLKLKTAPHFETPAKGTTVNEVLEGKYDILKDTGFKIHSDTKKCEIHIGKVKVTDNFTVADILSEWSKYKVYCFLKYDDEGAMPSIAVGRPYSSSKAQPLFPEDESTGPFKIRFNEHVAQSDLKVVKTDPKFLAVTGKALGTDEKFFEVTIRLNPEYDPTVAGSRQYQTVNATQISRKTHKVTGNTTATGAATKTKVDLSTYTIVPYMSPHIGIRVFPQLQSERHHGQRDRLRGFRADAGRAGGTHGQPQPLEERRLSRGRGDDHIRRRGIQAEIEHPVQNKVLQGLVPVIEIVGVCFHTGQFRVRGLLSVTMAFALPVFLPAAAPSLLTITAMRFIVGVYIIIISHRFHLQIHKRLQKYEKLSGQMENQGISVFLRSRLRLSLSTLLFFLCGLAQQNVFSGSGGIEPQDGVIPDLAGTNFRKDFSQQPLHIHVVASHQRPAKTAYRERIALYRVTSAHFIAVCLDTDGAVFIERDILPHIGGYLRRAGIQGVVQHDIPYIPLSGD